MGLLERLGQLFSGASAAARTSDDPTPAQCPDAGSTRPLKITFFGPVDAKRCPKSRALQLAWRRTPAERRGELIVIASEGDRTLLFDVRWPMDGGAAQRVQLCCVAGPSYFRETRGLALHASDAVLFVPTTFRDRADEDEESLEELEELLRERGVDPGTVPRAFVWLTGGERSPDDLAAVLNATRRWPAFTVDPETGAGIEAAVEHAVGAALARRHPIARR